MFKKTKAAFNSAVEAVCLNTDALTAHTEASKRLAAALRDPSTLERITELLEGVHTATTYAAAHYRHERSSSGRPTDF